MSFSHKVYKMNPQCGVNVCLAPYFISKMLQDFY